MDKMTIPYSQCTSSEEAYQTIKQKVHKVLSLWKVSADITHQDQSRNIHAKGKGFTMHIAFEEREAVTELTLSFPLSTLKKAILPPLEKELKKYL